MPWLVGRATGYSAYIQFVVLCKYLQFRIELSSWAKRSEITVLL